VIISSPLLALGIKLLGGTAIAAILFSATVVVIIQSSYAQFEPSSQQQEQQQEEGGQQVASDDGGLTATLNSSSSSRTFESEEDGFRLQVPQDWVIQDDDITTPSDRSFDTVAMLCLENEALPGIGGKHNCLAANLTDSIFINRWSDLQSMPQFQNESSSSDSAFGGNSSNNMIIPTTDDLVALRIQALQNQSDSQIKIENTTDVDEFTKLVNMTYQSVDRAGTILPFDDSTYNVKSTIMFVLSQDRNTGYYIANNIAADNQTQQSPAVQEVFDSFELVAASTTPVAATSSTTTPSPSPSQGQPQPQQLEQSDGGLAARLNAANFTYGDTITVNGTVRERGPNTVVTIDVIDPEGKTVELEQARITADNRFTHSFVANEKVGVEKAMVTSGNYLMSVQFGPNRIEFTFNYDATAPESSEVTASTTTNSISIPPDSSTLTTDAYQPNPVQVSVGDTITWTNDDAQPHTVTSGENVTPDGLFDSGIMAPAATFEHTFTEAGEFPYFCLLHPNMVGTVNVS
jgi:plastocyanin